ncbi:hypothetical protein BD779DRAFT_151469 [Infundibulicybe gibba]|nr:hypothetical protein BD779DRAFT_151469 [Infundibulicybe gibba]
MKVCTGKPSMLISPGALGLDPKVLVPRSTSPRKSGGHGQGSDSTSEQASKSPTCPSVFAMAGYIHDLATVMYPEGVQRPSIELNVNMRGGQFRYDRDFLLQFMNIAQ